MRKLVILIAPLALISGAGCTTERADGSTKIQTTTEADRENLKGAAAAPLRDLNVLRTKIPSVLLEAMADPYAPPRSTRCAQLDALIVPLNDALGADLDTPSQNEDDLLAKGRDSALGLMAGAASDVIPFRGWVRKLTGAEGHDHLVQAAITAGAVRRAYLKGIGESKGCPEPSRPSHSLVSRPLPEDSRKPRYPIR